MYTSVDIITELYHGNRVFNNVTFSARGDAGPSKEGVSIRGTLYKRSYYKNYCVPRWIPVRRVDAPRGNTPDGIGMYNRRDLPEICFKIEYARFLLRGQGTRRSTSLPDYSRAVYRFI